MTKKEIQDLIDVYGFWYIMSEFEMTEVDILMALDDAHFIDLDSFEEDDY